LRNLLVLLGHLPTSFGLEKRFISSEMGWSGVLLHVAAGAAATWGGAARQAGT